MYAGLGIRMWRREGNFGWPPYSLVNRNSDSDIDPGGRAAIALAISVICLRERSTIYAKRGKMQRSELNTNKKE
jgi:hypothetical protein